MININDFIGSLKNLDLNFATGVPDSLLKDLCFELENKFKKNHIIAANEGAAVAIGIGYHLKSGKIPIVYLQNSGLGNMINPILSLADPNVFKIPMLLIMGWRGEKKKNLRDEPQHMTQGAVTEDFLKMMKIKYTILSASSNYKKKISNFFNY